MYFDLINCIGGEDDANSKQYKKDLRELRKNNEIHFIYLCTEKVRGLATDYIDIYHMQSNKNPKNSFDCALDTLIKGAYPRVDKSFVFHGVRYTKEEFTHTIKLLGLT